MPARLHGDEFNIARRMLVIHIERNFPRQRGTAARKYDFDQFINMIYLRDRLAKMEPRIWNVNQPYGLLKSWSCASAMLRYWSLDDCIARVTLIKLTMEGNDGR